MIRIAVVDDNADICTIVKKELEHAATVPIAVVCYTKPEILTYDIQEGITYDGYFLDIDMPVVNGLELAEYIRTHQRNAIINFLTSHGEYALKGYDLKIQASNYVLKDRMKQYIPAIVRSLESERGDKDGSYIIENKIKFARVEFSKIYYVKADAEKKNIIIVSEYGIFEDRTTLKDFLEKIKRPEFFRVERGYIVNIHQILSIRSTEITLKNGDSIFIGRDRLAKVRKYISEYWGSSL